MAKTGSLTNITINNSTCLGFTPSVHGRVSSVTFYNTIHYYYVELQNASSDVFSGSTRTFPVGTIIGIYSGYDIDNGFYDTPTTTPFPDYSFGFVFQDPNSSLNNKVYFAKQDYQRFHYFPAGSYFLIVITGDNTFEFIKDPVSAGYVGGGGSGSGSESARYKYRTTTISCGVDADGDDATLGKDDCYVYKTSVGTTDTASNVKYDSSVGVLTNTDTGCKLNGYTPIRICGWYVNNNHYSFSRAYISSRSVGDCTVYWMLTSSAASSTGHGTLYLLWERL